MTEVSPRTSPTAFACRMLGIRPHATQSRFLECRTPTKVAVCGRRWGKSTGCAIDLLWFAVTRPGTVQMVIAPTHDQAGIIWREARGLAQRGLLAELVTRCVESPFPELALAGRNADGRDTESVVMARSSSHDAKYVRGHGADRVIVDECAFVADAVMRQTVPPMLSASAYRELVLIGTPFGVGSYFHERFEEGRRGDPAITSYHFPSSANPLLSAEYLEQQRRQMTELAYRTEYEAEFLDEQASVFRYSLIQEAIDESIKAGAVQGHRYVIGFDPAKFSDRSGVVVLDVTEVPHRAVEIVDIGGREYLAQAQAVRTLAQRYNRARVLLDSTSHEQMREELTRLGVSALGYPFSSRSKQELIDGLLLAFQRGTIRIPNHGALVKELTYYRFQTTPAGQTRLGAPEGPGHFDDLVTALALAVWQSGRHAKYVLRML